jgi:hypothetical protein
VDWRAVASQRTRDEARIDVETVANRNQIDANAREESK